MSKIVNAVVIDLTRPVEQKGFKSVLLYDTTVSTEQTAKIVYDTKDITGEALKVATAFFANGGQSLLYYGNTVTTASSDIKSQLDALNVDHSFYGIIACINKSNQTEYVEAIKTFADGNEKLYLADVNGDVSTVETAVDGFNSDRVVVYSNSKDSNDGLASAVAGVCFPQDEGSITWGNKAVVGVPTSGYTPAQESQLASKNINYITKEMGLVISQFGRTTSGSNADITRSKDYLKNRLMEALTSALVNSKKIPYTTQGMAIISSAMNEVGIQALNQGMLTEFRVITPKISEIPTNDKANRVLNGVKFIATLSGAVETINLEITVKL